MQTNDGPDWEGPDRPGIGPALVPASSQLPDVTYDPKAACFRNARGARMSVTFDRRWFPRAGEFPIYVPVKDTDAAGVTGRDLNDREQGLVDALMPPRRDTTPIGYEAVSAEEERRHSEAATREARKAAILRDEETPRYPEPLLAARQAALDRATVLANVDMSVAEKRAMVALDLPEQIKLARAMLPPGGERQFNNLRPGDTMTIRMGGDTVDKAIAHKIFPVLGFVAQANGDMVLTRPQHPVADPAKVQDSIEAAEAYSLHGIETARGVHDSVDHGTGLEPGDRLISDARKAELDAMADVLDGIERKWDAPPPPKDFNPKTAAGRAKPAMEFIPPVPLMHLAEVMRGGARKYGAFNWRQDKVSETTYFSAIHRHLAMWFDGQNTDEESGQMHLAHVMACCAILLDADSVDMLHHDRPLAGNAAGVIAALTTLRQQLDEG